MKDTYRKQVQLLLDVLNFQDFPSVKWKLFNLETFQKKKPAEWQAHIDKLEVAFRL
ncbi:hypothetical protein [Pantoea sp. GM01]|uniref:hypothetical protein n=1 Tax=Pantoea sp. GM01 TaxID=1144320 RepID=UPI0002711659|nr:hypothetical protein [Pantoea sp. GM01]EJL90339.1 hypothetical protein PMI17_01859 [Pantoea sp. GM01]